MAYNMSKEAVFLCGDSYTNFLAASVAAKNCPAETKGVALTPP
jgi:hypothetical protein